jgi:hypothetical protein
VQQHRPEMELVGNSAQMNLSAEQLQSSISALIDERPIECTITIFALGTAYLRLGVTAHLDGQFIHGLLACYEYAAYRPEIADDLLARTTAFAEECLAERNDHFERLTQRELPPDLGHLKLGS